MTLTFQDHFSSLAERYARARPTYPPALFSELAALTSGHDAVWDCGTGNGQAALGLAEHFESVVASDPSKTQLAEAPQHPRVTYRLGPEASSGLPDGSVDLVTAAQAAHWFDLPAFYREARRVLKPGGVIALWCYSLCHITPAVDARLAVFYRETVGPFWPPERHHIDAAYRTLDFPFAELPFATVTMEHRWTLDQLAAYIDTWSAVAEFRKIRRGDPLPTLVAALASVWGEPGTFHNVEWPLSVRAGRVAAEVPSRVGKA